VGRKTRTSRVIALGRVTTTSNLVTLKGDYRKTLTVDVPDKR